ncbi:MAG: hypothetical protein KatS3mg076_1386 [Candidatus Binatia bacterium]|nr:MAG: hypothetical protein KatS3mg076_1386 [Candidatus Binatia bacterium]
MVLPLGDAPNPRGVPWVTYLLVAANVAVYLFVTLPLSSVPPDPSDPLLQEYLRVLLPRLRGPVSLPMVLREVTAYDLFVFVYGFRPAEPSLVSLFTSMFLHGGFVHLFGNMLFLWIYGDNVEHRLGGLRFLVAYLATGVAATLFHAFFDPSPLPLVGASGAISGVLGFYFVWFPRNRVRLLVVLFPIFFDVILVPARLVLALYLLVDNLLPFLVTHGSGMGGVAYGAHIGGFLAGWGAARILDRREWRAAPPEYRRPVAREVGASIEAVRALLARGEVEEAARIYFALDPEKTRRALEPEEMLAFAEELRRAGHPRAALTLYRRLLRDYPRGPGLAEAHLGAGLVLLEDLGMPTPAYQHFLDALDRDPPPEVAAEARRALDRIAAMQKLRLGRFSR